MELNNFEEMLMEYFEGKTEEEIEACFDRAEGVGLKKTMYKPNLKKFLRLYRDAQYLEKQFMGEIKEVQFLGEKFFCDFTLFLSYISFNKELEPEIRRRLLNLISEADVFELAYRTEGVGIYIKVLNTYIADRDLGTEI